MALRQRRTTARSTPVNGDLVNGIDSSSSSSSSVDEASTLYNSYDAADDDVSKKQQAPKNAFSSKISNGFFSKKDYIFMLLIGLISAIVRLHRISQPTQVVFDEVHFGGFATKYIKRMFFMDVHPPLGKLLFAFLSYFYGFDGSFDFKEIGLTYIDKNVPYVEMRFLAGLMGVAVVMMGYRTLRFLGISRWGAMLGAMMVNFENALTCQSRLILLDSPLVFFTAMTIMFWAEFHTCSSKPFSARWWWTLVASGVALGLTASVKWVGLFLIATIGLSTLKDLWTILGDRGVSVSKFFGHFIARAIGLILVPFLVYAFWFQVHFVVLRNGGGGATFMSAEFQETLEGTAKVGTTYRDIGFGSEIMLRHIGTSGGFLHSHAATYPSGSKQQQVTLYPYKDQNSAWLVMKPLGVNSTPPSPITKFEPIRHGHVIRLEHTATKKRLHSHDVRPPMSDADFKNEISCYGATGHPGDSNDHFRVEIEDFDPKNEETHYLRSLNTKFRLVHVNTGCLLFSHAVKLPEWGFGQQEVCCVKDGKRRLSNWMVEVNTNPFLTENATKVGINLPGFWSKFFELHAVMWRTNNGLTSSHPYDSRPGSWFTLKSGISFWTGKEDDRGHIYLIGNPFVWLGGSLSVLAFFGVFGVAQILLQRRVEAVVRQQQNVSNRLNELGFLVVAWFLHYIPFFLMGRQLFLHHYLPALYFSILLFAAMMDVFIFNNFAIRVPRWLKVAAFLAALALTMVAFVALAPLTYGTPMSKKWCQAIKRLGKDWSFDCNRYE